MHRVDIYITSGSVDIKRARQDDHWPCTLSPPRTLRFTDIELTFSPNRESTYTYDGIDKHKSVIFYHGRHWGMVFSAILLRQGTPPSVRTKQSFFLVTLNRAEVTAPLSSHLTAAGEDEATVTSRLAKCLPVTPVLSRVYQRARTISRHDFFFFAFYIVVKIWIWKTKRTPMNTSKSNFSWTKH